MNNTKRKSKPPSIADRWIRVEQELPAYGQEVLVTCGEEIGHCTRETDEDGEHYYVVGSDNMEFYAVIAWQPNPCIPAWAKEIAKKRLQRLKRARANEKARR